VPGRTYRPGWVRLVFAGTSDTGVRLPDGIYVPVIHLGASHRTITLPNPIRLDTHPPVITVPRGISTDISPGSGGHHDSFHVAYSLNGPAQAILLVDGRRVEITRSQRVRGELMWDGRRAGQAVPPGRYTLEASARDAAGNVAKPFAFAVVTVRYVELASKRISAKAGKQFVVAVLADAPVVSWRLGARHGASRSHTLRLRAPAKRGVYRLYVTAAGHVAQAVLVVV
jgi:hypothetical protein